MQFVLRDIYPAKVEKALFDLLDSVAVLCMECVHLSEWDEEIQKVQDSLAGFEDEFPALMVSISYS